MHLTRLLVLYITLVHIIASLKDGMGNKKLLYIPKLSTVTYGKQSLRYLGPKLWNDTFKTGVILVSDIQKKNIPMSKIKTIHNFINALKRHYLYLYSSE